ncbi:MAG: hypothetical protein WD969_05950 [Paracoccaceae bacterium]
MELTRRKMVALVLSAAAVPNLTKAHNNPTFKKVAIAEVEVLAEANDAGAFSAPFDLDLPKGTVQLHFEVQSESQRAALFSIASGDRILAAGLTHEGKSKPLRDAALRIVDVTGATGAFTLRIVAEVMVRATG